MKKQKAKQYTVILLYRNGDEFDGTFMAHTRSDCVCGAVANARRQMAKTNDVDVTWYEDAPVIAVLAGWHVDVYDNSCD